MQKFGLWCLLLLGISSCGRTLVGPNGTLPPRKTTGVFVLDSTYVPSETILCLVTNGTNDTLEFVQDPDAAYGLIYQDGYQWRTGFLFSFIGRPWVIPPQRSVQLEIEIPSPYDHFGEHQVLVGLQNIHHSKVHRRYYSETFLIQPSHQQIPGPA